MNLETKALADAGLAHVQMGRVAEGMALLDESMVLACGPADDLEVVSKSVCSFFTACSVAADFDRASSWGEALRRCGVLSTTPGLPQFVHNHCESVHARALLELGRWGAAETVLDRSIDAIGPGRTASWHSAVMLAELRIRQGRLSEAEVLLTGKEGDLIALVPAVRLQLALGDLDLARAMILRGLRVMGDDRVRAAELLGLKAEVEIGLGNLDGARAASEDQLALTEGLDVPGLRAQVFLVRARVLEAVGDLVGAIGATEGGLNVMGPTGMPWLRLTLLLRLAALHDQAGNRAAASVEARVGAALLAELDVALSASEMDLLRRCGVAAQVPATATAVCIATLSQRDRAWVVSCHGTQVRFPDSKGIRYLGVLVSSPGVERHVLDPVDRVEGVDAGSASSGPGPGVDPGPGPGVEGVDRRWLGDAGDLVDRRARTLYRRRIEALRYDIEEALAMGAADRAEVLQAELDELVGQLAAAFGLGGRGRRTSSAAERARLNVTRALRAATARVREELPEAGACLDSRLRTGAYCAYEPNDDDEVRWVVRS